MRCSGVADVIESVHFARENNLLVSVRGGGHNISGAAVCDKGLMIDLSSMRAIHVDPKAQIARVQGGPPSRMSIIVEMTPLGPR